MTDDFRCTRNKSHAKRERRFLWEIASTGDWRAFVECVKCEPPERISEITDTEAFAALLPPKPPTMRTMI